MGSRAPGRTPGRCVVTAPSTQGPAVPDGGGNLEGQVCPPTITELPPWASPGQGVKVLLVGDVRMGRGTRPRVAARPREHLLGGSLCPGPEPGSRDTHRSSRALGFVSHSVTNWLAGFWTNLWTSMFSSESDRPPGHTAVVCALMHPETCPCHLSLELCAEGGDSQRSVLSRSCVQGGDIAQKNKRRKLVVSVNVRCCLKGTGSSSFRTLEEGEVDKVLSSPPTSHFPCLENKGNGGHLAVTTGNVAHGKRCLMRWCL